MLMPEPSDVQAITSQSLSVNEAKIVNRYGWDKLEVYLKMKQFIGETRSDPNPPNDQVLITQLIEGMIEDIEVNSGISQGNE